MIGVGAFERAVGDLLKEHGWYLNDGWRRHADARALSVMPPALSAGEAIDETIGLERALAVQKEQERIMGLKRYGCQGCGADLWIRGSDVICINIEHCDLAVPLRPGEVAR